jgi:hypothetical protein
MEGDIKNGCGVIYIGMSAFALTLIPPTAESILPVMV